MTQLSAHFTLRELTRSNTAAKNGIRNTPSEKHINALKTLCNEVLEPVRAHFNAPVVISSGYRSAELNRFMGGAPNSQHTLGQAADIEIPGVPNVEIFDFIAQNLVFDQLIAELLTKQNGADGWIHVSYAPKNRMETLSYLGRGRGYVKGLVFV